MNSEGFDSAQTRRDEDDLDRWRIAAEICEVILATPAEWSVRIGIFGKWGEGKSTVLYFAEQILKEKRNIVFTFTPWAIQNSNDLWEEFGNALSEALSTAKVPFDGSWKARIKASGKWLESTPAAGLAELGATAFGREKLLNGAFSALNHWLKWDGAQVIAIREKLQGRRLIILIDDLDRCAPALIPQLLLSLRELLDLPGFTFVLAFDDEIVAQALKNTNPAWMDGSTFLEKILDFRFHLPQVTERQKERLVLRSIKRYCPFVPKESAEEIKDLLPNNPRKLKALIRSLAALQPQLVRHNADELNWVDIWLAQMIRIESYPFFERLLRGDTLNREIGPIYRVLRSSPRLGKEGEEKDENLKRMVAESGVDNPIITGRLVQLIEAARARASVAFQYACELTIRPHAITWKEFRSLLAAWNQDQRASILTGWVTQHVLARAVNAEEVENELFDTIVTAKNNCLSEAAESMSVKEHDSKVAEAQLLLAMVEQFTIDVGGLTASRFKKLYGQASYWIGFRKNASDKKLRDLEQALLLRLLRLTSGPLSTELFEIVYPENPMPDIGEGIAEKQALRQQCVALIAPKAAKEAMEFLIKPGGVQSLTEQGRFSGVRFCLFHPESPVWNTDLRAELLETIGRGRENLVIYLNIVEYFRLLVEGLEVGIGSLGRQNVLKIFSDQALVKLLWEVVTSKEIQYRTQVTFIRARATLLENGVAEGLLPLTPELQQRIHQDSPNNL